MTRHLIMTIFQYALVGYLLAWNLMEFVLSLIRWRRNLASTQRKALGIEVPETASGTLPPVSFIVPIQNGSGHGVKALSDLLSLAYSNCEFILVNDGSTDTTLDQIVTTFRMQRSAYRFRHEIRSARVLGVYTSLEYPSMLLVDKERGGRADSLHVGINHSRFPLICPLALGTVPSPDSVKGMLKYFQLEPESIAAVAGRAMPSLLQAQSFPPFHPPSGRLSTALAYAEIEQLDLGAGRDWSAVLNLVTLPDTVAVLRKDLVLFAGGYRLDAEDPEREFWIRYYSSFRAWNMPRRILFKEDPVGIVLPTDGFLGQMEHYRLDQRHLLKILLEHFGKLFAKPAGGLVGLVGLPLIAAFRALLPMVLVFAMVGVPILFATRVVPGSFLLNVLLLTLAAPVFRSLAGALLESHAASPSAGFIAHFRHGIISSLHRILFAPAVAVGRTLSLVDLFRRKFTQPLVGTDEDYDVGPANAPPPLESIDLPIPQAEPPPERLPEGLIQEAVSALDSAFADPPEAPTKSDSNVELPVTDLTENIPSDPLDLGSLEMDSRDEKEDTSPILPAVQGEGSDPLDLGELNLEPMDRKPATEIRPKLPAGEGDASSSLEEPLDLGGIDPEGLARRSQPASRALEPLDPTDIKRALEMLAQSSLFYGVLAKDRNRILPFLQTASLAKDEHALSQGEVSPALFLVVHGELEVFRFDEQGRESAIGYLHPGDSFGELSMLTGEASPATVRAKTASRLLAITRQDFPKLTAEIPWLGVTVARLIAQRLTRAGAAIVAKLREGVPGRLDLVAPSALIEAIHLNGLSGTLAAQRGEESMIAYFEDGRICGAQTDRSDGESAFFEFLGWTSGSYSFVPGKREGAVQTIQADMVGLLLEGMRRMQEGRPASDFAADSDSREGKAAVTIEPFSLADEETAFLALSRIPLFAGLRGDHMKEIIRMMQEHRFAAGEDALRQGQIGQAVYVVASGAFDLVHRDTSGVSTKLSTLHAGQWFNELSMITGEPVPSTITCAADGTLIEIRRETFKQLLGKVPALGANLARIMAVRLARASRWAGQQSGGEAIGQLETMPPADLIQAIHINQQTGTLKIEAEGKIIEIDFIDGRIHDARLDDLRGDEAVMVTLAWTRGEFSFRPGKPTSEKSVSSDTMGLLLRGMRRLERARQEAAGTTIRRDTGAVAVPPAPSETKRIEAAPAAPVEVAPALEPVPAELEDLAFEAVSASTLFFGLHSRDRQALRPHLRLHRVAAGGEAVRPRSSAPAVFIGFTGAIEVLRPNSIPLRQGPGATFNEMAFLTGEPAVSTVWAVTDVNLLAIPRAAFPALTADLPWLGVGLARLLAHRLFVETEALAADLENGRIGRIELLAPAQVVEAVHIHELSGTLSLSRESRTADLTFHAGQVIDARVDALKGEAAFREALSWASGSFRFEKGTRETMTWTLFPNTTGLLLEASRGRGSEGALVQPTGRPFTKADAEAAMQALRRCQVFSGLRTDELREVLASCQERICAVGEKLVRQGQLGQSEFVVASGKFEITEQERKIGARSAGENLDGLSMITGEPESVSITCTEAGTVLEISREAFKRLLGATPALVANLARILAVRLARASRWAAESANDIKGNLDAMPAVELLQALHHSRATGTLQIEGRKKSVEVDFADGRIQGARLNNEVGDEALFRLLGMTRGAFSFAPGTTETPATITAETIALLFRGMRRAERQGGKRGTSIIGEDGAEVAPVEAPAAEPVVPAPPPEPEPAFKLVRPTGKELDQAIKALSKTDLFSQLGAREKKQVRGFLHRVEIEEECDIVAPAARVRAFFVVEKGNLAVSRPDADKTRTLPDLAPGDWFGEMPLLTGEASPLLVQSKKSAKLVAFPREDFSALLASAPWIGPVLARVLANRIYHVSKGLAEELLAGDFGRLEAVAPQQLVEALFVHGLTGTLKLARGSKSATLYVQDGQVYEAATDSSEGEAAFYDSLAWTTGSFKFEPTRKEDAVPTLHRNTLGLLLESARRRPGATLPEAAKPTGEPFTRKDMEAVIAALGRIPVLSGLRADELKDLTGLLEERPAAAKDDLLRQGRQEDDVFILASGACEVIRRDEARARSRMGILGPGEVFGELSMLTGGSEGATVTCTADGSMLALPATSILQAMSRIPALILNLARFFAVRLARASKFETAEGDLDVLPPAELLQTLHDRLATGVLKTEARKKPLEVEFSGGRIITTRLSGATADPDDVIERLLGARGPFTFATTEAPATEPEPVEADTLALVFRVLRSTDRAITSMKEGPLPPAAEEETIEATPPPDVAPAVVEAPALSSVEGPPVPVVAELPPEPVVEPPAPVTEPTAKIELEPEPPGIELGSVSEAIDVLKEVDTPFAMTPLDPDEIKQALEALAQSRLFFGVHARDRYRILPYIRHARIPKGGDVLTEKKPGRGLFLLVDGEVDVIQKDEQGGDRLLAHLGQGECFGEMSMLTGEPASATVRTTVDAKLIAFTKEDFPKLTGEFPWLGVTLARLIAQRLTRTSVAIVKELRKGMVGRLDMIPVSAVVQAVNVNQQSGTLHIGHHPMAATAYFQEGQLYTIRLENRENNLASEGEEAFYDLLAWTTGSFRFEPQAREGVTRQIMTDTVGLLLEGMRRIDEERMKTGGRAAESDRPKSPPRAPREKSAPFSLSDPAAAREALGRIAIFSGLREEQLNEVLASMQERRSSIGDVIIRQDQLGQALYVIAEGEFDVNSRDEAGAENKLAVLQVGDCFGELSLLTSQPTSSTVTCSKEGRLVLIPREQFMQLLGRVPSVGASLARILASRLANASRWISEQTEGGFAGRLEAMPPAELVQAINVNQQSGTLNVRGGNKSIEIIFINGQVRDASGGEVRGEEAFFALLEMRRGTFTFRPGSPSFSKTIDSDTIGLLFRGMRRAERAANAGVDKDTDTETRSVKGVDFDSGKWAAPTTRTLLDAEEPAPVVEAPPPPAAAPAPEPPAPAPAPEPPAPASATDEALKRSLLFAGVSDDIRRMAAELGQIRRPPMGEILVPEGSQARELFIVLEGAIEVIRQDVQNRSVPVATLGPGEVWGIRTMLTGQPSSYRARAHRGLQVMAIPASTLVPMFEASPILAMNAARVLASRIARAAALVLQGKPDQVRPAELLESLHLLGHSGQLKAKGETQSFEAVFESGQVVYAAIGKTFGVGALAEFSAWPSATVSWKPGSVKMASNVVGATSDILLHIGMGEGSSQDLGTITSDLGLAVEGLRRAPIFRGLHADELAEGLDAMRILEIEGPEELLPAGKESKALYAIQEGMLRTSSGETLGPGSHFGGITALTGQRERETIMSSGPTRLLVFSQDDIGTFMAKVPAFGVTMARGLACRILETARWMMADANHARTAVTEDHSFATVLEAAHALRVTGTLNLRRAGMAASAFVEWGEVTHLSAPGTQGKGLLGELVKWTDSTLEWIPGTAPFSRNVTADTRWLIFDALASAFRRA